MKDFVLVSIVCLVILLLHHALITYNVYQNVWWSDIVLHFLGGAWVGMAYAFLIRDTRVLGVIVVAGCIGLLWEITEFFLDIPFFGVGEARLSDPIWLLDTLIDLTLDLVGAFTAWSYFSRHRKSHA